MKKTILIALLLTISSASHAVGDYYYTLTNNTYFNYSGIAAAIASAGHHFDDNGKVQLSFSMGTFEQTSAFSFGFAQRYKNFLTTASVAFEPHGIANSEDTMAFNMAIRWEID